MLLSEMSLSAIPHGVCSFDYIYILASKDSGQGDALFDYEYIVNDDWYDKGFVYVVGSIA